MIQPSKDGSQRDERVTLGEGNPFKDMVSVEVNRRSLERDNKFAAWLNEGQYKEVSDPEEYVLVPLKTLRDLERSERELQALNDAGVDNWEGRDYVNWNYVETGEGSPSKVDG